MSDQRTGRPCKPGCLHHWQLIDASQPPPRTHICAICGKHAPAAPDDPDYETYRERPERRPSQGWMRRSKGAV